MSAIFKLFIVDDDKVILKSLEHYLTSNLAFKNEIKCFDTSTALLENIDKQPNLIVLDYYLEEGSKSGLEILKEVLGKYPDITIIVISAQEEITVAMDTLKHGAYDYIVKSESTGLKINNTISKLIRDDQTNNQLEKYKKTSYVMIGIIVLLVVLSAIYYLIK